MVTDVRSRLPISDDDLAAFCRKWKIVRLELFGSALRDDFDPKNSDFDLLVTWAPDSDWGVFDHVRAEGELATLLQRRVDLVDRSSVESSENYLRRRRILRSAQLVYESA